MGLIETVKSAWKRALSRACRFVDLVEHAFETAPHAAEKARRASAPGTRANASADRMLAETLAEDDPSGAGVGAKVDRYRWKSYLGGRFTTGQGPLTDLSRSWWESINSWVPRVGGHVPTIDGGKSGSVFPSMSVLREAEAEVAREVGMIGRRRRDPDGQIRESGDGQDFGFGAEYDSDGDADGSGSLAWEILRVHPETGDIVRTRVVRGDERAAMLECSRLREAWARRAGMGGIDGATALPDPTADWEGEDGDGGRIRDPRRDGTNGTGPGIRESVFPPELGQLDPPSSNAPDWQYRQMGGRGERDLLPLTHIRQMQIAFFLWIQNPIANRAINIKTDFVLGDGFKYRAKDPRVQKVLDRFWKTNKLEARQKGMVLESCLFGELIRLVSVERSTGLVRMKFVDVLQCVQAVVSPWDVEEIRRLVLASRFESTDRNIVNVVRIDDDPTSKTFGRRVGNAFFHKFNSVANATRGHSDLLSVLDWVDALDQFMFGQVDRSILLQTFVWDVELQGMDDAKIMNWLKMQPGVPQPGSIRAHNEKVKWNPLSPDLKANDAINTGKLIREQVVGGVGLMDWMFGSSGPGQGKVGGDMTTVTMRMISGRQKEIVDVLTEWGEFAIDQAIIAGTLPQEAENMGGRIDPATGEPEGIDRTFSVVIPMLQQKDFAQIAASVNTVATALAVAVTNGWLDEDQAADVFVKMIDQLGFDLAEERKAEKEKIAKAGGDPADAGKELVKKTQAEAPVQAGTGSESGRSVDARTGRPPVPTSRRQPSNAGAMAAAMKEGARILKARADARRLDEAREAGRMAAAEAMAGTPTMPDLDE